MILWSAKRNTDMRTRSVRVILSRAVIFAAIALFSFLCILYKHNDCLEKVDTEWYIISQLKTSVIF